MLDLIASFGFSAVVFGLIYLVVRLAEWSPWVVVVLGLVFFTVVVHGIRHFWRNWP